MNAAHSTANPPSWGGWQVSLRCRRCLSEADELTFTVQRQNTPYTTYLSARLLTELASAMNREWKIFTPSYSPDGALRPLSAKLQRRRPPSQLRIYTAQVRA